MTRHIRQLPDTLYRSLYHNRLGIDIHSELETYTHSEVRHELDRLIDCFLNIFWVTGTFEGRPQPIAYRGLLPRYCRVNAYGPRGRPATPEQRARRQQAAELYIDGHSLRDLAQQFGVSRERVRQWLILEGVERRPAGYHPEALEGVHVSLSTQASPRPDVPGSRSA